VGVTITESASRVELVPPPGVSHVIETADGPVHYVDLGEGPPLLFISAWGPQPGVTGWLTYRAVRTALARRYRCLVVDLPNFGLTGPVVFHEPAHDVAARAAFAVLDACSLDAVPVIGTSMGATTALDMALAAPDRVRALVIGACHASTGGDPYLLAPFPSESSIAYHDLLAAPAAAIAKRKPGASIILITLTGVPSIDASTACFEESATKAGLRVLTVQSNTADNASGGNQLATALLAKYPDVDAFYDYNDASAEGVSSALLAAGMKVMSGTSTTGIQVWGNGADSDGIAALKQGRLTGTVDSNLTESGWAVVKVMQMLLEKKPVKQLTVKSSIVDSSNVGTFIDPSKRTVTFTTIPVASQTS
jgi:hypothetical protein